MPRPPTPHTDTDTHILPSCFAGTDRERTGERNEGHNGALFNERAGTTASPHPVIRKHDEAIGKGMGGARCRLPLPSHADRELWPRHVESSVISDRGDLCGVGGEEKRSGMEYCNH